MDACLRPYCHKTRSNQLQHAAAVCWADRVSHSEHLLLAVITTLRGWKPSDSHQPHSWPDHWRGICTHADTHTNTHAYISSYTAACVPTANTLLHAEPHKLCHFIFVPVTISHVFSGRGWIIPRGANACGPMGPQRAGPRPSRTTKIHAARVKEHSEFWGLSWFYVKTSSYLYRSFS